MFFHSKPKRQENSRSRRNSKDGYYIFRVKYAFVGSGHEAFSEHGVYLESKDGNLKEISAEDLYIHSAMNMAIDDPAGEKGEEQ